MSRQKLKHADIANLFEMNDVPKMHGEPKKTGEADSAGDAGGADEYTRETKKLRRLLKLVFYATFKLKDNTCSFHSVNIFLLLLQVIKIALLTSQVINFGYDRNHFSELVNRGHLTLRHLMLEHWDATWETLAYPPSRGDFAVYTINDLESGINFAVEGFFNADHEAAGYFVRTPNDSMAIHVKYFDFPGGAVVKMNTTDLQVKDQTFPVDKGLTESKGHFSYDINKEFKAKQFKQPLTRLLSTTLEFSLHSVRVHATEKRARCLRVNGWVTFKDLDNNGQVTVNLETLTSRIKCRDLNLPLTDWALENTNEELAGALLGFSLLSILSTTATIALAAYVFKRTKQYMRLFYRRYYTPKDDDENDLPASEYRKFVKLWNIVVIISDILTLYGTVWIVFENQNSEWIVETLDSYTVWLGVGCILAWISNLRFFKFHNKFHLLFMTLRRAFSNVVAFLICVIVLFVGFWISGFVVLGPYHVKFRTPGVAAETLLSVVNGDEIFFTMAILETNKTGGDWVWWFSRFYIGIYVSVFTIVIINLLIAIYISAYEAIRLYYEESPEERDLGPMEKALRRYLAEQSSDTGLRTSIYGLLSQNRVFSNAETDLRKEMKKLVRVSGSKRDVILIKPRTLDAFMEDEEDKQSTIKCGSVNVSIIWFFG